MRTFLLWMIPPVLLGLIGFAWVVGSGIAAIGDFDVVESNRVEGVVVLTADQPRFELQAELTLGGKVLSAEEALGVQTVSTPLNPTSRPVQVAVTITDRDGSDIVEFALTEPGDSTGVEVQWTADGWVEGSEVDGLEALVLTIDGPVDTVDRRPLAVWSVDAHDGAEKSKDAIETGMEVKAFEVTVLEADTALSVSRGQYGPYDSGGAPSLLRVATEDELHEPQPGTRLPLAVPTSCREFPCTFRAFLAAASRGQQFEIALFDDDGTGATAELINLSFTHNRTRIELAPLDVDASLLASFDLDISVDKPRDPIARASDFVYVEFEVVDVQASGTVDPGFSGSFSFADRITGRWDFAVPVDSCCDLEASGRIDLEQENSATGEARVTVIVDYLSVQPVEVDDRNLTVTIGELVVELR